MAQVKRATRCIRLFYLVIFLLFAESLSALFVNFHLPRPLIQALYPDLSVLSGHCSDHPCLYDSYAVGSLYVTQLLTLVGFGLLLIPDTLAPKPPLPRQAVPVFALLVLIPFSDYLQGNFTFAPKWVAPNSVTESPLGLFRFAMMFTMAAVGMMACVGGGTTNGASKAQPARLR